MIHRWFLGCPIVRQSHFLSLPIVDSNGSFRHSSLKTAGGHTECHAGTRAGGSTKWDDTSIPVSNSKIDLMQE